MKQLKEIILEKLKINSKSKVNEYKYFPKKRSELKKIIDELIKERGYDANLNDIDTSEITDMHSLFLCSRFNGDISQWDVSNVTDMYSMFRNSKFDGDLSKWNISNVKNTEMMFDCCPLEKNPPKWYHE